jgi:uncharacterized protein
MFRIEETAEGIIIDVKIIPSSSRDSMAGSLEGVLRIKVSAPPEKGKANKSLINFLSKRTGLKNKDISIISGKTNPLKRVKLCNITADKFLKAVGL